METNSPSQAINYIFRDVFELDNPFSLEDLMERFCESVPLPRQMKCSLSGAETWLSPLELSPPVNPDACRKDLGIEEWLKPKKPIRNMDELLAAWKEVDFQSGDKIRNSVNVEKSDSVMGSSNVFYSSLIGDSKNIYFSYNNFNCTHLVASRGNYSCSLGIRMMESIYCSSGFAVSFSNKVAKSIFVNDSFDCFECMFCYNLASKRYCIANMQFEVEEYMKIKSMVVKWILENFGK